MTEPKPGEPCPTCGHVVPKPEAPPAPAFWGRLELPTTPPPPVAPAVPFMRGSGRRWSPKGDDAA